jgi:threonine aldolase
MTWQSGIDAVSFGGTKNGLMGVEAAILFDPALAWEFELRRKRSAHLFSKHRFLSAQMLAYLTDDLWLTMARAANESAARLAQGLRNVAGVSMVWEPQANLMFFRAPRALHQRLLQAGAQYYVWDGDATTGNPDQPLIGRLVCDWSVGAAAVDRFLAVAQAG